MGARKENLRIRFSATVVMTLLVIIGFILIIVNEILLPKEIIGFSLISKLIDTIACTLISIGCIDFFLSVSTEKEIVDRIQTKICENTDYTAFSKEQLKLINEKVTLATVGKRSQRAIFNEDINNDIIILSTQTAKKHWKELVRNRYLDTYARRVQIILKEDSVLVRTRTKEIYYNLMNIPKKKFTINSLFYSMKEANSFKVKEFYYNGREYAEECNKTIKRSDPIQSDINKKCFTFKTPWSINMETEGYHEVAYETEYETDYAVFFQEKIMTCICKNFSLEAEIIDNREGDNNLDYILRWEIFCTMEKTIEITQKNAYQGNEYRFSTYGNIEWFPQDGGYILTLNHRQK